MMFELTGNEETKILKHSFENLNSLYQDVHSRLGDTNILKRRQLFSLKTRGRTYTGAA